ncbi:alpha-L-fucosidase [Sphingobacterium multivorum]|uniref:alpha-L-fucosidase n=1 Tax=Sphingobacterium multivorum TaxID=28454 RepID=UPI00289F8468|nr:alpha-L-fucosidase [Sphingobacterium multivorum]
MRYLIYFICIVLLPLHSSCQNRKVKRDFFIKTVSSSEYSNDKENAIYPGFCDDIPYMSWNNRGSMEYFQLKASGGKEPYLWKLKEGRLPDGMHLDTNGKLFGRAISAGRYDFLIEVSDAEGFSVVKELNFEISDFRAKWLADAKFGIMVQWGTFIYPALQTKEEIASFEKRISHFDADKWVKYIKSLGAEVLNFTVKAGDGVRLWPSRVPSKFGLNIKRNIVKELIDACHRNNIKFVAYFAPDHIWNKKVWDYYPGKGDYGTGELNLALVGELVDMGIDGIWVDMSALPEIYPNVDPKWFLWEPTIRLIRTKNPNVTIASNPGIFYGGTIMIDEADVAVYEGGTNHLKSSLAIARPYVGIKRRAIEVDNVLDSRWWSSEPFSPNPKPAKMIIENIEKNWKVGATYMLNYPLFADGDIAPKEYRSILEEIGDWVKANKNKYKTQAILNASETQESQKVNLAKFDKILQKSNWKPNANKKQVEKATLPLEEGVFSGINIAVGSKPIKISQVGVNSFKKKCYIEVVINRFADGQQLLKIGSEGVVSTNGLTYISLLKEVVLNAGEVYTLAVKTDQYLELVTEKTIQKLSNEDFDVLNMVSLNRSGKKFPSLNPKAVSFVDVNYFRGNLPDKENYALSSLLKLQSNLNGQELLPSKNNCFSFNAVDGDINTVAQATGEYAWTFFVDMKKVKKVERIKLNFADFAYPTDFDVLISSDGNRWSVLKQVPNNSRLEFDWNFLDMNFRFLKIKANKPDNEGQKGDQMGIAEIGIW